MIVAVKKNKLSGKVGVGDACTYMFSFIFLFVDIYQYTFTKENFRKTVTRYFCSKKYFWYFLLSKKGEGVVLNLLGGVRLVAGHYEWKSVCLTEMTKTTAKFATRPNRQSL